jgi:hypothetical protein
VVRSQGYHGRMSRTKDAPTTHSNRLCGKPEPFTCVLKKTFVPRSFQKQPLGRLAVFVGSADHSLPMVAAARAHSLALVIAFEFAAHAALPESPHT